MTEIQIEKLLEQMPLKGPSPEMDESIDALLRSSIPSGSPQESGLFRKFTLAGTLLLGLCLGFFLGATLTTNSSNARRIVAEERDVGATQDGKELTENSLVRLPREFGVFLPQQTVIPGVATFCGLGGWSLPGNEDRRCLDCHDPGPHGREQFLRDHPKLLSMDSCSACHDMSDKNVIPDGKVIEQEVGTENSNAMQLPLADEEAIQST